MDRSCGRSTITVHYYTINNLHSIQVISYLIAEDHIVSHAVGNLVKIPDKNTSGMLTR